MVNMFPDANIWQFFSLCGRFTNVVVLPSRNFMDAGVSELHLFEYSLVGAWRGPALFPSCCPSISAILSFDVAREAPVQLPSVRFTARGARRRT
jgi:hypothetical protein